MNANLRNFALWVIIVLLLLALFTLFQNPGQRTSSQDISFSQLLTEVDQGRVRDVVIQGPEIHGTFTDGRNFNTYAPNDPGLVQKLYSKGVSITARPQQDNVPWFVSLLGLVAALHRADRGVDLLLASDAGGRRQGARLRQVAGEAADRGAWPRHLRRRRRRRRGEAGSAGDRRVPARPASSSGSADAFRAACCWSDRPAPARRCSRARSPARRTCRSSPSPAPTSSRCSSASARRACATCSSRRRRTRPASSSSTRSTPSAAIAAPASAAATTSASRR